MRGLVLEVSEFRLWCQNDAARLGRHGARGPQSPGFLLLVGRLRSVLSDKVVLTVSCPSRGLIRASLSSARESSRVANRTWSICVVVLCKSWCELRCFVVWREAIIWWEGLTVSATFS